VTEMVFFLFIALGLTHLKAGTGKYLKQHYNVFWRCRDWMGPYMESWGNKLWTISTLNILRSVMWHETEWTETKVCNVCQSLH